MVTQPDREKGRGRVAPAAAGEAGGGGARPARAPAAAHPRARGAGGAARARPGAAGRRRLRADPAPARHRHRAPRHGQRPLLAPAPLPRRGADPLGDRERRRGDGRHDDADRRGARHRPDRSSSRATPIGAEETTPELEARLARARRRAARSRRSTGSRAGRCRPVPQDHAAATLAPILQKEDGRIDWTRAARRPSRGACAASSRGRGRSPRHGGQRPQDPARARRRRRATTGARAGSRSSIGDGFVVGCGAGTRAARARGAAGEPPRRCRPPRSPPAPASPPARGWADRAEPRPACSPSASSPRSSAAARCSPSAWPPTTWRRSTAASARSCTSSCSARCAPRGRLDARAGAGVTIGRSRSSTPPTLTALRLGAYQVLRLRVPDRAAVSESVDLARAEAPRAAGFVNAVLRRLAREGAPPEPDAGQSAAGLADHHRLAAALARRALAGAARRGGGGRAGARLRGRAADAWSGSTRGSPTPPRASAQAGITLEPLRVPGAWQRARATRRWRSSPTGVALRAGPGLAADRPPRRPATAACSTPARRPGGKSTLLADLGGPRTAWSPPTCRARGVRTLRALARALGRGRRPRAGRATRAARRSGGAFDSVLLDAPCSGLGTLGRNPDIRWRARAGRPRPTCRAAARDPGRGRRAGGARADASSTRRAASSRRRTKAWWRRSWRRDPSFAPAPLPDVGGARSRRARSRARCRSATAATASSPRGW